MVYLICSSLPPNDGKASYNQTVTLLSENFKICLFMLAGSLIIHFSPSDESTLPFKFIKTNFTLKVDDLPLLNQLIGLFINFQIINYSTRSILLYGGAFMYL